MLYKSPLRRPHRERCDLSLSTLEIGRISLPVQTEIIKFCIICRETTEHGSRVVHTHAIEQITRSKIVGVALATKWFDHAGFELPCESQWVCGKCAEVKFNRWRSSVRVAMRQFHASDIVKFLSSVPVVYASFPVSGVTPFQRKDACARVANLASMLAHYGSNTHFVAVALKAINTQVVYNGWKVLYDVFDNMSFSLLL